MKTLKITIFLSLALLFLNSCSSTDDDEIGGGLKQTDRILKIELVPNLSQSINVNEIDILLVLNSPNQKTDVVGEIYKDVELFNTTKSVFSYELTDNNRTLNFTTTEKVYGSGISILLSTNASTTVDRTLYTLKVYADNELVKEEALILGQGEISKLFAPLIDWDLI